MQVLKLIQRLLRAKRQNRLLIFRQSINVYAQKNVKKLIFSSSHRVSLYINHIAVEVRYAVSLQQRQHCIGYIRSNAVDSLCFKMCKNTNYKSTN